MIALSAPTLSYGTNLVSRSGSAIPAAISRRAKRVATLDGGAVPVDSGYSSADLSYRLTLPDPDGSQHQSARALLVAFQTLILSCNDGCFLVLLSALDYSDGATTATAEVLEVLS